MTPAEQIAQEAWEAYVAEARKRARMEGDPNFSPAEKVAQQRRVDAAFASFRTEFSLVERSAPPSRQAARCAHDLGTGAKILRLLQRGAAQ